MHKPTPQSETVLHTEIVRSDGPTEVVIRQLPADPRNGSEWFRVFRTLITSGTWAGLGAGQQSLLIVLECFRDRVTGTTTMTREEIQTYSGLGERSVKDTLKSLLAHDHRLLALVAADTYRVMPEETFAGRRTADPGPEVPEISFRRMEENFQNQEKNFHRSQLERARSDQTSQRTGQRDQNQIRAERSSAQGSLAGQSESQTENRPAGGTALPTTGDARLHVLRALDNAEIREPLRSAVAALTGVTAEEIEREVAQASAEPGLFSGPVVAMSRLFARRGLVLPRRSGGSPAGPGSPPALKRVCNLTPDLLSIARALNQTRTNRVFGGSAAGRSASIHPD